MKFNISMMRFAAIAAMTMLIAACADQKLPAQQAIEAADTAAQAIAADAQKYVPEQFAEVTSSLTTLKANFDKGDYKSIMAAAPDLMNKIKTVGAAALEKKEAIMAALKGDWTKLAAEIPQMVSAIQSRVDILSSAKKLPANLSAENFAGAKAGLDSAKQMWTDATAAFGKGDVEAAVTAAKSVQSKGEEVLKLLGMSESK